MRFFNKNRGFSLVELLGVVGIIALLASVVIFNIQDGKKKARDTQRISDLQQIQIALRLYKDTYGKYPCETVASCADIGQTDPANGRIGESNNTITMLLESFIAEVPHDPFGPGDSEYYYYFDPEHACTDIPGNKAVLYASKMERSENINFLITECSDDPGVSSGLGGEGRGGGTESYNVVLGDTSG